LRRILVAYPPTKGLTDDCEQLLLALKDIKIFEKDKLSDEEYDMVFNIISEINGILRHRR